MAQSFNLYFLSVIFALFTLFTSSVYAEGDPEVGAKKAAVCTACHGPKGNSAIAIFPKLAGQHADYIVYALKAYKNKQRQGTYAVQMYGIAGNLSEQDMADLAAYYAAQ